MREPLPTSGTNKDLAKASHRAHRYHDAVAHYQRAMRDDPLDFDLWLRCGQAAADAGLMDVALPLLTTYARMSAGDANAHFSLAYALFRFGQLDAAAEAYRRSIAVDPARASAWCALGQIAYMQGDPEAGRAAHDAALALPATTPLTRFTTSVVRLLRGDFARGWADHEARWDVPQLPPAPWRADGLRQWEGESLHGVRLHVHSEGGHGDTIMLARFLPELRARGASVRLYSQAGLAPLLAGFVDELLPPERDAAALDPGARHCGSFSLPHLLGVTVDAIPSPDGYLAGGDPRLPRPPRAPGSLRVGLVWAGNPGVVHDFDRSAPRLELLRPLFEVPDVEWTSLQHGPRAAEAAGTPLQQPPPFADYADTARVIRGLDLVISVDTSVAHLAGAIGHPTWTIVPTAPEFRWLLDRDSSPWYSSMRLFRRPSTGAWSTVAALIARSLADQRATLAR